MFQIGTQADPQALREAFAQQQRLQVADFLTADSAHALHEALSNDIGWKLTANRGEEILDFDLEAVARWAPEQHALLDKAVAMGGRFGFQFRYEVIRLTETSTGPLAQFRDFMSSPAVLALLRTITDTDDIAFADAHASRYRPGHFLSTHDDRVDKMGRRAAYVMNLTPQWRPDWGGLLQFFDNRGDVTRAFMPNYNTLNIFSVPQLHNVSWVTPLAAAPRYAVTGWLRAET